MVKAHGPKGRERQHNEGREVCGRQKSVRSPLRGGSLRPSVTSFEANMEHLWPGKAYTRTVVLSQCHRSINSM